MIQKTNIVKNEDEELPIPDEWREVFVQIVDAFVAGDFELQCNIVGVAPISKGESSRIMDNIQSYGDTLISLPSDTWNTSIYQWMRGHWEVLVDLFTADEGASDLVLFVSVYDAAGSFRFEVESVHVP